jgi:hypothetical protein
MSTFIQAWPFAASDVAHDTRLRGAALPTLLLMQRWTASDGVCQFRVGKLCGHLHQNRRTVEMAVNVIERAGYYKQVAP